MAVEVRRTNKNWFYKLFVVNPHMLSPESNHCHSACVDDSNGLLEVPGLKTQQHTTQHAVHRVHIMTVVSKQCHESRAEWRIHDLQFSFLCSVAFNKLYWLQDLKLLQL